MDRAAVTGGPNLTFTTGQNAAAWPVEPAIRRRRENGHTLKPCDAGCFYRLAHTDDQPASPRNSWHVEQSGTIHGCAGMADEPPESDRLPAMLNCQFLHPASGSSAPPALGSWFSDRNHMIRSMKRSGRL